MIKKYCDCCGKKLEYIRTFSKTMLNSRKKLLETSWYCKNCNLEFYIDIKQDIEEE